MTQLHGILSVSLIGVQGNSGPISPTSPTPVLPENFKHKPLQDFLPYAELQGTSKQRHLQGSGQDAHWVLGRGRKRCACYHHTRRYRQDTLGPRTRTHKVFVIITFERMFKEARWDLWPQSRQFCLTPMLEVGKQPAIGDWYCR
jgi:hypothetical protein